MKNVIKKCIPYLSGKFSKLCSNKKKSHYGFKAHPYPNILIPLANWTIYASILNKNIFFLKFNAKRGEGLVLQPSTFQNGEGNCSSFFAHEVVLVKFKLQTHMEYLSSCRSGFLVALVLLNLHFSVNSQPLNNSNCLFVMLYLYI